MNLTFHTELLFRQAARYARFSPHLDDDDIRRLKRVRVERPDHVSKEDFQLACDDLMRLHEQDKKIHIASEQSWVGF